MNDLIFTDAQREALRPLVEDILRDLLEKQQIVESAVAPDGKLRIEPTAEQIDDLLSELIGPGVICPDWLQAEVVRAYRHVQEVHGWQFHPHVLELLYDVAQQFWMLGMESRERNFITELKPLPPRRGHI